MPVDPADAPDSVGADDAAALPARPVTAVILKGYPRLSETFIAQELLALERAGFALRLFSLRRPTDKARHRVHDEIRAPVTYLPEYLGHEPRRVLAALCRASKSPGFGKLLRVFWRDLKRERTRNRLRRLGQALVLADELPADVGWLYAHFIHTPGSVARYAHLLNGLGWSCSAHARDIWTTPDRELADKLASASWTVTCTREGHRHLSSLAARPETVHLMRHGLDPDRFPPPQGAPSQRDGAEAGKPLRILTVGRAVAKKGLDTLVDALALLPDDLHWRWTQIGGGVLSGEIAARVRRSGLDGRVRMEGARAQDAVLDACRDNDLFVLPCRIAADGDRDGLPNVLVEAQSQRLACISTPLNGITELIEDGVNGLLVPPEDPPTLAKAIERLGRDPAARARMGRAGMDKVRQRFDHRAQIRRLTELFATSLASGDGGRAAP